MADLATVERAFMKADAAGDSESASVLAAEVRRLRADQPTNEPASVQPEPAQQGSFGKAFDWVSEAVSGKERTTPELESLDLIGNAPELNALNWGAFKSSLGLLLTGKLEEQQKIIKQNIPEANFRQDEKGNVIAQLPSGDYALQKPGVTIPSIARFGTELAAYTPAGKTVSGAGALAKVGQVALQSGGTAALIEEAQNLLGGDFDTDEIYMATALGAAGKTVEEIVGAISKFRRGAIPEEAAKIIRSGEEADVPVLTTDVIEPKTLVGKISRSTGESIPLVGTGATRAEQQTAREELVNSITGELTPKYDEVVSSLIEKTGTIRKSAGNRLQRIGDEMEGFGQIPTANSIRAIDEHIAEITAPGRVADDETVKVLEKYKTALEEGQTFKLLDTLRTDFRKSVKGERQSLPDRSNVAMNEIYDSMTNDIDSAISSNIDTRTAKRFKQAKGVWAEEMNTIKKTRLKSVLDKGDVTPEVVKNLLISQKPSEMKQLYRRLTPKGRSAARATILSNAMEKAATRVGGLTPDSFTTQLGKHKNQINIFFKGEEKAQLKGLEALLNATRRAQEAKVATPTGQQLLGATGAASIYSNPVATIFGGGGIGTMARVYESKRVRDALLKINSVSGDARDLALMKAAEAIQAVTQATRSQDK